MAATEPQPSPHAPHEPVHKELADPVKDVPTVKPAAPTPVDKAVIFFFVFENDLIMIYAPSLILGFLIGV